MFVSAETKTSNIDLPVIFREATQTVPILVNGVEVPISVSTVPTAPVVNENRFGVSLSHAKKFIDAFKNQRVRGYKVCQKYHMTGQSASVHAETFQWNILNAKVITRKHILRIIYPEQRVNNFHNSIKS